MSEKYNGWTNYETWNVNLWMDNDEGSQSFWESQADDVVADHGDNSDAVADLAKQLETLHRDEMPEVAGCYADLLGAAISEVNWYEIAEHYIDGTVV
jgi:hypothetical protein